MGYLMEKNRNFCKKNSEQYNHFYWWQWSWNFWKEYQNVMKPFYRIDKSRGQNKSGVGLGLSIANDIIRSHGGNISLEKSPLNGLRVKISLPL